MNVYYLIIVTSYYCNYYRTSLNARYYCRNANSLSVTLVALTTSKQFNIGLSKRFITDNRVTVNPTLSHFDGFCSQSV